MFSSPHLYVSWFLLLRVVVLFAIVYLYLLCLIFGVSTHVFRCVKMLDSRIYKNNMFITCFHKFSYIVWSISVIHKGSEGSCLVGFVEAPKMSNKVLQSIWEPKLAISVVIQNNKNKKHLDKRKSNQSLNGLSVLPNCHFQVYRQEPRYCFQCWCAFLLKDRSLMGEQCFPCTV